MDELGEKVLDKRVSKDRLIEWYERGFNWRRCCLHWLSRRRNCNRGIRVGRGGYRDRGIHVGSTSVLGNRMRLLHKIGGRALVTCVHVHHGLQTVFLTIPNLNVIWRKKLKHNNEWTWKVCDWGSATQDSVFNYELNNTSRMVFLLSLLEVHINQPNSHWSKVLVRYLSTFS